MKNENSYFTRKFINLLLKQQKKDNSADLPRGEGGLSSVRDIFSSKKYLKHWERGFHEKDK